MINQSTISGKMGRFSRLLLWLQVPLIVAATALLALIGWKIQPLLIRYSQLSKAIADQEVTIKRLDTEIVARQQALARIKETQSPQLGATFDLSVLTGFKIGVYFLDTDVELTHRAEALNQKLQQFGVPAEVQLYPKSEAFLKTLPLPKSDEVRYEDPYETVQGQALLSILKKVDPAHTYSPRIVLNRTANFITIFLKRN